MALNCFFFFFVVTDVCESIHAFVCACHICAFGDFSTHFCEPVNGIVPALSGCTCLMAHTVFSLRACIGFICAHMKPLALTQVPQVINRIHRLVSIYVHHVP